MMGGRARKRLGHWWSPRVDWVKSGARSNLSRCWRTGSRRWGLTGGLVHMFLGLEAEGAADGVEDPGDEQEDNRDAHEHSDDARDRRGSHAVKRLAGVLARLGIAVRRAVIANV